MLLSGWLQLILGGLPYSMYSSWEHSNLVAGEDAAWGLYFYMLNGTLSLIVRVTTAAVAVFFLQTKIAVRKYNLLKQELTKKLFTNCRWVSSIAVHPRGSDQDT